VCVCRVLRCLGDFIPTTTFMRDLRPLLQIRQFARLRSATCSLQGLSPARRVARAAPSGDLALGVMHLPGPKRQRWAVTGITTVASSAASNLDTHIAIIRKA
jgi:hypothetical protein